MEKRYYKLSENELLSLLRDSVTLSLLVEGGVDNWKWYGGGWDPWLREMRNGILLARQAKKLITGLNIKEDDDVDMDDIAELRLGLYEQLL